MNEVSCRTCTWILEWLEINAISPELWVVGLPVRLEELQSPDSWIDWNLCVSLSARLERLDDRGRSLIELGRELSEQVLTPESVRASLRGVSPEEIYLHHAPEILGSLFSGLTYQVTDQSRRGLTLRLDLPERVAEPRPFFELCVGFLERAPQLLGREAARVEADLSSKRAHFTISGLGEPSSAATTPQTAAGNIATREPSPPAPSRLQTLLESTRDVVCELGRDGRLGWVSPRIRELLGRPPEHFEGKSFIEFVLPEDRDEVLETFGKLLISGEAKDITFRATHCDGSLLYLQISLRPFQSDHDDLRMACIMRDITAWKRAHDGLRRSRDRYRSIVDNASNLVGIANREGRILLAGSHVERVLGLPRSDDLTAEILKRIHPDDIEPLLQVWGVSRAVGDGGSSEFRISTRDSQRWYELSWKPFRDSQGEDLLSVVMHDITDHKRAQLALRDSELRYRMLAENPYELVSEVDNHGHFVYVSPSFHTLFDYSPEELLGRDSFLLIHPDDRDSVERAFRRAILEEGPAHGSFRFRHRNGSYRWVDTTARAYRSATDRVLAVLVSRDVTQRKEAEEVLRQTEEHLRQSQKMEAIGRLAGGIAHDFNNLLTAITGYCDLLLEEIGSQHAARSDAEEILKAAERAGALTHQLLAFSRRQVLQPKVLDLNTLVADIDRMLRRLIGEDIELVTLLSGELCPVKADPGQLQQVIVNLVVNARDAMPRAGKISLETANTFVEPGDAANEDGIPPGAYVTLTVQDTGIGMDSEILSRIWEPFFTTKESGKGTGLGLSTVHGIISQSGGHIRAQSEAGRGSRFTVYLPQVEPAATLPKRRVEMSQFRGSETVLVIEDADPVRKLVARYLQRHGYKVLDVTSGAEALRQCACHSGEIHLLITDVVLPKMDGPEIAQRVVELRPEIRVMYMSGFSDELLSQHRVLAQDIILLQKPFTPPALLRTVRETLDRPDPPVLAPFDLSSDDRDN